eukprot:gene7581-11905_t
MKKQKTCLEKTLLLNLNHFVEELQSLECEDKSRYSAFVEYFEEIYSTENGKTIFNLINGLDYILEGLKPQKPFVMSTCIRILGIYCQEENNFTEFLQTDNLKKIIFFECDPKDFSLLKIASINSIIKICQSHQIGRDWILSNSGFDILKNGLNDKNQYVRNESYKFFITIYSYLNESDISEMIDFLHKNSSNYFMDMLNSLASNKKIEIIKKFGFIDKLLFYIENEINLLKSIQILCFLTHHMNIEKIEILKIIDMIKIDKKCVHQLIQSINIKYLDSIKTDLVEDLLKEWKNNLNSKKSFDVILSLCNLPFSEKSFDLMIISAKKSHFNQKIVISCLKLLEKSSRIPKEIIELLISFCQQNNSRIYSQSLNLLIKHSIVDDRINKIIEDSFENLNWEIRESACEFIKQCENSNFKTSDKMNLLLIKSVNDQDCYVRSSAIQTIIKKKIYKNEDELSDLLLNSLQNSEPHLKILVFNHLKIFLKLNENSQNILKKEILKIYNQYEFELYPTLLEFIVEKNFDVKFLNEIDSNLLNDIMEKVQIHKQSEKVKQFVLKFKLKNEDEIIEENETPINFFEKDEIDCD